MHVVFTPSFHWTSLGDVGDIGRDGAPGINGTDGNPGQKGKQLATTLLHAHPHKHTRGNHILHTLHYTTHMYTSVPSSRMHVAFTPSFHWTSLGDVGDPGRDGAPGINGTDGNPGQKGKQLATTLLHAHPHKHTRGNHILHTLHYTHVHICSIK